LYFIELTLVDP